MVKQQIIDWVKLERGKGISDDKLRAALVKQKYSEQEIKEALGGPLAPAQAAPVAATPASTGSKKKLIIGIAIGVVVLLVVIGGIYYYANTVVEFDDFADDFDESEYEEDEDFSDFEEDDAAFG